VLIGGEITVEVRPEFARALHPTQRKRGVAAGADTLRIAVGELETGRAVLEVARLLEQRARAFEVVGV
jgi:hypothetical protein